MKGTKINLETVTFGVQKKLLVPCVIECYLVLNGINNTQYHVQDKHEMTLYIVKWT